MSSTAALLADIRASGITLSVSAAGKLRAQAQPGVMTREQKVRITAAKLELLELLEAERAGVSRETRRQAVLAMLEENPHVRYAWLTDTDEDHDYVVVALAVRGVASCELSIPRDRYDGFALLRMIDASQAP